MKFLTPATSILIAAVLTFSLSASAGWEEAVEAFERGDHSIAEAHFLEITRMRPDFAEGYYMLGRCQIALGEYVTALENLQRACALSNADLDFCEEHAMYQLFIESRSGGRLAWLEDWNVFILPPTEIVQQLKALEGDLANLGEYGSITDAITDFSEAFERNPKRTGSAHIAIRLAVALALSGQSTTHELRWDIATVAEDLANDHPEHRNFILAGWSNYLVPDLQRAFYWFDLAVAESPNDPLTLYSMSRVLESLGRRDEALLTLEQALFELENQRSPDQTFLRNLVARLAKLSESTLEFSTAAEYHRLAGNEDRARRLEELGDIVSEPLEVRNTFREEVKRLQTISQTSTDVVERNTPESIGQKISDLQGNIGMINEGLEQAVEALSAPGGREQAQAVTRQVRQTIERPRPEDLGLIPLRTDELWVIAKPPRQSVSSQITEPPQLCGIVEPGREVPLPLKETVVHADVNAYIATVGVTQHYLNPYDTKIEAIYSFPLPQDASVYDFLMTIGDRRIRGVVRERADAVEIYRKAKSLGHQASLLTQERPNIFTQRVANIEPHREIDISLTYFNTLPYRDGGYEFAFPTLVGPRFNPPHADDPIAVSPRGPSRVPEGASEVQYLQPADLSRHRVSLTLDIEAGVPIGEVYSPSHQIDTEELSATRRRVTFADGTAFPDRDFVVRWTVSDTQVRGAFLGHQDGDGGYFTLVLNPPDLGIEAARSPTEHVFLLDFSGSMKGEPRQTLMYAVRHALSKLDPKDTFQVITFSNRSDAWAIGGASVPASQANTRKAYKYLMGIESRGGTLMLGGIEKALGLPLDPKRGRVVSLLTDGFIGNEAEILAAIHNKLGAANIYTFGVGSSPNRFLLERVAKTGGGAVAYVGTGQKSAETAIDGFFGRVARPVLSDLAIDWQGLKVSDVFPTQLPDLHSGRPVIVSGRIDEPMKRTDVRITGLYAGQPVMTTVRVDADKVFSRPSIANVWARMKIADLADRSLWDQDPDALVKEIRAVALNYGLMSKYTAFLAVDAATQTGGDHGVSTKQAVPVPAGVRYETTVESKKKPGRP